MQLGKSQNNFDTLNHAKFGKSHLKVILVSGAGFFTDAYDLFCMYFNHNYKIKCVVKQFSPADDRLCLLL